MEIIPPKMWSVHADAGILGPRLVADLLEPTFKVVADMAAKLDRRLKAKYFPPNLRDASATAYDVWNAVYEDGLPLVWVPRTELVDQLLETKSYQARLQFLTSVADAVLEDCRQELRAVTDPEFSDYREATEEAADALEAGLYRSAQALAANILEASLMEFWGPDERYALRKKGDKKGGVIMFATLEEALESVTDDPESVDLTRVLLHFAAVWHAYGREHNEPLDQGPLRFNRHATSHGIGQSRYSPGNALVAVMLASSHLRTLQDLNPT